MCQYHIINNYTYHKEVWGVDTQEMWMPINGNSLYDKSRWFNFTQKEIESINSILGKQLTSIYNNIIIENNCNNKLQLYIFKLDDEYFYISCSFLYHMYIYKCDQIDGLLQCIQDIFLPLPNFSLDVVIEERKEIKKSLAQKIKSILKLLLKTIIRPLR